MANERNRPDVAVFIDFENVYVSARDKLDANPNFESIMDRCEDLGRVVIARAYADWYRYPRVTSALYANGIEPMYVPTYYYDREMGRTGRAIKNSVDMNLCVDAMKTLFTNPNISRFVLATGDRDFIPLVNTIRQQGKEVIVIGIGGAASAHLAQSADEFIFYESLVGKPTSELLQDQPSTKMPPKGREQYADEEAGVAAAAPGLATAAAPAPEIEQNGELDIYDVLVKAINLARERGYVCSFGSLKLLMKELMGGEFKEGRYRDSSGKPFAKFKDFVMEAERRGKVQVFTNGTVNEVFLPGEDPYKLSQFAQELKEEAVPITPSADGRAEPRTLSPNGRRRRRRPRGEQRPTTAQPISEFETTEEPLEGLEEQAEAPETPGVPDLFEPAEHEVSDAVEFAGSPESFRPDLSEELPSDFLFEGLLERVEQEQNHAPVLDPLAAEELAFTPPPREEQLQPAAVQAEPAPGPTTGRPFTEDEWRILREIVARFERPASFVQIYDALRDARNTTDGGIVRTNEELRTLIKQAINSGMLQRIGKGNRIAYQLAPETEVSEGAPAGEAQPDRDTAAADQMAQIEQAQEPSMEVLEAAPDQVTEMAPLAAAPTEPEAAAPDQMAQIEHPPAGAEGQVAEVEQAPVTPLEVIDTAPDQVTEALPPVVSAAPEQAEPVDALDEQVAVIEEIISQHPAPETFEVVAPDQGAISGALVEEPGTGPAKPARRRKRAATPPAEEAQPAAEPRPKRTARSRKEPAASVSAEATESQAAPKPKSRSRRKKAENVPEEVS